MHKLITAYQIWLHSCCGILMSNGHWNCKQYTHIILLPRIVTVVMLLPHIIRYQMLLSLPEQRNFTTKHCCCCTRPMNPPGRCSHYQSVHTHYTVIGMFSLLDQRILTTGRCSHYQLIRECNAKQLQNAHYIIRVDPKKKASVYNKNLSQIGLTPLSSSN